MVEDVSTGYSAALTEFGRDAVMRAFFAGDRIPELWLMLTVSPIDSTDSAADESELDDYSFDPVGGTNVDTGYRRVMYATDGGWVPGEPGSYYNEQEFVFSVALTDWVDAGGWALVTSDDDDAEVFAVGFCDLSVMTGEQVVIPAFGVGFVMEGN